MINMNKRPKRGETEDDILRIQEEFLAEKAKNPKIQPAAQIVKLEKAPNKSLFAQSRSQKRPTKVDMKSKTNLNNAESLIFGEIHEKIIGNVMKPEEQNSIANIVLGDIVENTFTTPKEIKSSHSDLPFPAIEKTELKVGNFKSGKSIFAQSMSNEMTSKTNESQPMDCGEDEMPLEDVNAIYGAASVIVEDEKTAAEVHKANLEVLRKMDASEIMAERAKLLNSLDPSIIALLARKRQEKSKTENNDKTVIATVPTKADNIARESLTVLPSSSPALEIIEQSNTENWIHFDVVEKDKLEWMRDIPMQAAKLKPGEKFEARFDWKGILLPYSTDDLNTKNVEQPPLNDERELYLHGNEPHRPGYTLQELFRLARSNVVQQRVSAFGAIAGILNLYNQGFYDKVLELPISKMFFLLRFGLDDNTSAMLEVVSKALAALCYNDTDETLLDFLYDNPGCHWQPTLLVIQNSLEAEDPTSLENLQMQMQQLQMNASSHNANIKANIEENEDESKTTMSDFQLAETDLMDCLLRTNILQRIYFILNTIRPDNSTVSSCLKLLIRLAHSSKDVAVQIANNEDLLNCLFENFLPGMERIDAMQRHALFYNYPQHLCLKLFRVLLSQSLGIAVKLLKFQLSEKLQNYLFSSEDIRGKLIKVQIESLRILRCLLLLRVDNFLYRRFVSAFRFMLEWHFNHTVYEEGGAHLIRQHAAALLAAISSCSPGTGNALEVSSMLGDLIHKCSSRWFYQAKRHGIKEFSQSTLLSASLHAVTWFVHHCGMTAATDIARFQQFIEKYLCEFLASEAFVQFVSNISGTASIVLRESCDRRNVHPPLPNVGAVVLHQYGPQLIVPQVYAVPVLNAIWRLLELMHSTEELKKAKRSLLINFIRPQIIEPLVEFLRRIPTQLNRHLATNFFAKQELQFIFKLLTFEGIATYFTKSELLAIVYNFLCCLTAEYIPEIEKLLELYIFNSEYLAVDAKTLNKWCKTCLELVHSHYIVVPPTELTLSIAHTQPPVLPVDWPYFQLKIILQNYIDNVQQKPSVQFSEQEVLQMTFIFVAELEHCNPNIQIVSPTEKLMYFMIAFLGPDSQFLEPTMRSILEKQLRYFYEGCAEVTFDFDASYEGKCRFENLYALFVDHFQAASYGDELFSSLVMVPLAQKYDNKWRRRVWSDYASALRFLNCDERWLIGGMQAYLEPVEQEESLIRAYSVALRTNQLRMDTLPYNIAKYHVEKYIENKNSK